MTIVDGVTVAKAASENVTEIAAIVDSLDTSQLSEIATAISEVGRVYVTGSGRSGLMGKAIAMRLMHTGLDVHVVGETTTPGIQSGDLFVAVSSSGDGAVLAQAQRARSIGATIAAFTAQANTALAEIADHIVVVPARSSVATRQHAGSLFEQSCLVVGDAICRAIQDADGVRTTELDRRHANL